MGDSPRFSLNQSVWFSNRNWQIEWMLRDCHNNRELLIELLIWSHTLAAVNPNLSDDSVLAMLMLKEFVGG